MVAYKELTTFPSEWEVWKRLLQGVISSQVWKSVLQVFKFQIVENFNIKVLESVWKRVLRVVDSFNVQV